MKSSEVDEFTPEHIIPIQHSYLANSTFGTTGQLISQDYCPCRERGVPEWFCIVKLLPLWRPLPDFPGAPLWEPLDTLLQNTLQRGVQTQAANEHLVRWDVNRLFCRKKQYYSERHHGQPPAHTATRIPNWGRIETRERGHRKSSCGSESKPTLAAAHCFRSFTAI